MVFSSQLFLFGFLPLALLVYYTALRGPRGLLHGSLALLSYGFYGWTNPPFVLLMLFSTAVDYACGRVIAKDSTEPGAPRTRRQRQAVAVSVLSNLSLLAFFKYTNFALDQWNVVMEALGLAEYAWRDVLRVTLPLGISFYTFQSMSYSIDVYRGHARPARSLLDFACYVSLFSQLVAGPILRWSELDRQLLERTHTLEKFARGVAMFSLGLAKKVLLANPAGKVADVCFGAGSLHALDAWLGAFAYSFQIYFDFSGYTDMALGLGLMMGFVFPKNFDAPYRSRSITEFWRRWHISLSSFLRDYLYVPLGGNRRGPRRTYVNLLVVMLLGGLWHGAAATFVVWGALHGVWLALERAGGRRSPWARLPAPLAVAATFVVVTLAWVFFRATSLDHAGRYLASMFGLGPVQDGAVLVGGVIHQPYYLGCLLLAAVVTWAGRTSWDFTRVLGPGKVALCLALLWLACAALFTQSFNPFIYFVF